MSLFRTKGMISQISRGRCAKSHTDGKSVGFTDSGGEKTETFRNKIKYLVWNTKIFNIITCNVRILFTNQRLKELEEDLKNIKWNIIGHCEIRRREEELLRLKLGHVFYCENPIKSSRNISYLVRTYQYTYQCMFYENSKRSLEKKLE